MEFVNECITALDSYAFRSFGLGERGLQRGAARGRFRRDAHDLAGECVTQVAASEESYSGCSLGK